MSLDVNLKNQLAQYLQLLEKEVVITYRCLMMKIQKRLEIL